MSSKKIIQIQTADPALSLNPLGLHLILLAHEGYTNQTGLALVLRESKSYLAHSQGRIQNSLKFFITLYPLLSLWLTTYGTRDDPFFGTVTFSDQPAFLMCVYQEEVIEIESEMFFYSIFEETF